MKYKIRPYIHNEDEKYLTLFTEIHKLSLDELNSVLKDMENVFSGQYSVSCINGVVVSSIEFDRENSKILYYDDLIGEEPTMEIYNMLKDYRDAIIKYEESSS